MDPMPYSELIYCSTIAPKTKLTAICDIQATSQLLNSNSNITGLLVFSNRYFLQVLEGPTEAVDRLYARIGRDARHRNTTLIGQTDIAKRMWADWSMGLFAHTPVNRPIFDRYFGGEAFNPYSLNAPMAKQLLMALTDGADSQPGPLGKA